MDYIRIKSQSHSVAESQSRDVTPVASENVTETPSRQGLVTEPTANGQQPTAKEVKDLLKDWIKLYPNSFAPDVEFKIYQLADGDVIIQLHEDLSSMAVSLLVLYFETTRLQDYKTTSRDVTPVASENVAESPSRQGLVTELVEVPTANSQQPTAYITIDDTEVLLKQNEGKRAMVIGQRTTVNSQQTLGKSRDVTPVASENKMSDVASVRFILEDNYALDYNFEKRAQPVKDCDMVFEEPEFTLPEEYESVRVGDVVKKKIDEILDEGLTPKKLLMYLLCGAIGLGIGFLIVYFMSK